MSAFLVGLTVVALVMLIPGNVAGWLTTRDIGDRPWNWRVFLGPVVYVNWNDRRQATRPQPRVAYRIPWV